MERRPPIVYRGEYQTLDSLLARHGADLMHIYFGHTGVHLLPFIQQWDKPCVVSFHGADVAHKEDIKDYPAKLRLLFDAVPLLFARSQSLADRLIQLGCPPEKLRINRTGVPLKEFPFVDRQPPPDDVRALQRVLSREGADGHARLQRPHVGQLGHAVDVHQHLGPGQAEIQERDQALSARQDLRPVPVLGEQADGLVDLVGRDVLEARRLH